MTGRERILAVLAGQETDRLASMPITMMFAADILGVKYGQYAREYATLADAQVKTAEMFGFDYVSAISDPAREAADTGAALQWFDDQPPAIIEEHALLLDKAVLGRLRPPELIPAGAWKIVCAASSCCAGEWGAICLSRVGSRVRAPRLPTCAASTAS